MADVLPIIAFQRRSVDAAERPDDLQPIGRSSSSHVARGTNIRKTPCDRSVSTRSGASGRSFDLRARAAISGASFEYRQGGVRQCLSCHARPLVAGNFSARKLS